MAELFFIFVNQWRCDQLGILIIPYLPICKIENVPKTI